MKDKALIVDQETRSSVRAGGICMPGCPHGLVIQNLPANARNTRDAGLIPGLGGSPGGGNGNPIWYSCWEKPMDYSLVGYSPCGCKESDMTKKLSMHTYTHT